MRFDYLAGGTTGGWAAYRSPWPYDLDITGGSITSISGGNVFMPNLRAMADIFHDRPGDFRQNWGTNNDNFYQSYVARRRKFDESVNAAYLMGTGSLGRIMGRVGVRWEETSTDATEPDSRTPAEMRRAGFPITAAGVATTIPGLNYQFLSQPRVHRKGEYDNFFHSASLKYRFLSGLDLHLGYSSTIRRPSYVNLAGVWLVNDANLPVTAPNAKLKPETADNYAARLAYYFEPVGQLAVTGTQRNVRDLIVTDRLTAR